jgi:hydroxypyruvate reductase
MTFNVPDPPHFADFRRHVDEIVSATIAAADADDAVSRYLRREGRFLTIGREPDAEQIDLDRGEVYLVASGKAAVPMARAALRVLGDDVAAGIVITKDTGLSVEDLIQAAGEEFTGRPVKIFSAGHPVPDERSVGGTKAVVDMLAGARREDAVICLISGGTSSLLTQPLLPLEDWRKLVELLLKSGCTINELNAVRRSVDRIKSGGLARATGPATCYGLILSDVIGNQLNVIGSGPTVPEEELVVGAVQVLGRYDIARQLEREEWGRLALALNQARFLHKSPRPSVRNFIIGDVRGAATAALVAAIRMGFVGQLLTAHLDGQAREIGRLAAGIARDLPSGQCLIMGGETTVTVRGKGLGGRNQELALAAALALERQPRTVVFSFTTDGEDGPTPAAGAVITGETARLARSYGLDPVAYLVDNGSHTFFDRLDNLSRGRAEPHLITTGPTSTNVNDLIVVLSYGD